MFDEDDNDDLVYVMSDTKPLVDKVRKLVFAGFGFQDINDEELEILLQEIDEEELDNTISLNECQLIASEYFETKKTRKGTTKYILTNENFTEMIEAINSRLVSNILTTLVDKGELETAWDEEANDFIFWVVDHENKDKK